MNSIRHPELLRSYHALYCHQRAAPEGRSPGEVASGLGDGPLASGTQRRLRTGESERSGGCVRGISDESTPTRKARPKNTLGAELRATLVAPGEEIPLDPEALRYIALTTSGTATANYPADAGGKTAVYVLRWVGPRGAVGPWSDIATATIAA